MARNCRLVLSISAVTAFAAFVSAQSSRAPFGNCIYPALEFSDQVMFSSGTAASSTCDFLYKAPQPGFFSFVGPNQLPPLNESNELVPTGVFSFMNPYVNENPANPTAHATIFVQKGYSQDGLYVVDDNVNDNASKISSGIDVEMFNIPPTASRNGIHVHMDKGNAAARGSLYGLAIGAHAPNSIGIGLLPSGSNSVGIETQATGQYGMFETDGTAAPSTLATVTEHVNHFTSGNVLEVFQQYSAMTGDLVHAEMAAGGSGSFSGNFLSFSNRGTPEFKLDSNGNVYSAAIKAPAGQKWFVCVDDNGKLSSQPSPCNGG